MRFNMLASDHYTTIEFFWQGNADRSLLIEFWEFELLRNTQPGWLFVPCELVDPNKWETYENWTMMIGKSSSDIQKCIWHLWSFPMERIVLNSPLVVLEKAADVPCKYWTFIGKTYNMITEASQLKELNFEHHNNLVWRVSVSLWFVDYCLFQKALSQSKYL